MSSDSDISLYGVFMKARMSFGEWLEDAYLRKGFTQSTFAEEVGVGQSTVSNWVTGLKKPQRRRYSAIASVLEEDIETIRSYLSNAPLTNTTEETLAPYTVEDVDMDDPMLMLWASHKDNIDEHDRDILAGIIVAFSEKGALKHGGRNR